ncbi:MAG: hypothetical protein US40_C0007G0013 [Candidatus Roizmanbacteria bacterium GW2011_GWC2_37_13]|uniref:Uncharacterized protein n=1 Tax=Candidatus Roizmanbacteria bacterium GW2011_GWC2_37_13 TaxID=1618486 RepID=A0A0G0IMS9_9BACT|nr:MAG: hypothetical protein US38_C0012G0016 [Candidatus Roizmanbacteria bacterium GW2011_GWC1_37_12]KKQ25514.1 MAG: hypothetical protein US40_C0007G0013 [Candidatus Roizmanbacteria bacterium GW2011_GWC2_37_13]
MEISSFNIIVFKTFDILLKVINPNFVIVGVILQTLGSWSYLVDTLKGRIKPNKVSWLLWSISPLIAFVAMIKQGVGITALATFIVGFVPLVIFIASFFNRKAEWKITTLDIFCGTLSVLGLVFWLITKVGNIAIFFSILADGLAAIPTIVKSYLYPKTENSTIFIFGFVNAVIALLALNEWNFQNYGFPIYLLFVNALLVSLIKFKMGLVIKK